MFNPQLGTRRPNRSRDPFLRPSLELMDVKNSSFCRGKRRKTDFEDRYSQLCNFNRHFQNKAAPLKGAWNLLTWLLQLLLGNAESRCDIDSREAGEGGSSSPDAARVPLCQGAGGGHLASAPWRRRPIASQWSVLVFIINISTSSSVFACSFFNLLLFGELS